MYLGIIYHLIEIFKGHDDFADELSEFPTPDMVSQSLKSSSELGPAFTSLSVQRRIWSEGQERQRLSYKEGKSTRVSEENYS